MTTAKKETPKMGRVTVPIKVENAFDLEASESGTKTQDQVRTIEINALVDTGAALLCLAPALIYQLGLRFVKEINVDTATGVIRRKIFKIAWLTIMGRSCPINVVEIESKSQALVGYLPLEALDLVIDPKKGTVIPNPEHGDEMIIDLL